MINMDVEFKGINRVLKNLTEYNKNIENGIREEFEKAGKITVLKAQGTLIRNDNVRTGDLLRSVDYEVDYKKFSSIELKVVAGMFYAKYVERRFPFLFPSVENEKVYLLYRLRRLLHG